MFFDIPMSLQKSGWAKVVTSMLRSRTKVQPSRLSTPLTSPRAVKSPSGPIASSWCVDRGRRKYDISSLCGERNLARVVSEAALSLWRYCIRLTLRRRPDDCCSPSPPTSPPHFRVSVHLPPPTTYTLRSIIRLGKDSWRGPPILL